MNFPTHSPERSLSYDDSYEGNVRCYGNPPKGYRWLKVDDRTTKNTLMVMSNGFAAYNSSDRRHPRKVVLATEWPAIEPIAKVKTNPTIGDRRPNRSRQRVCTTLRRSRREANRGAY